MTSLFQKHRFPLICAGLLLPAVSSGETTPEARALLDQATAFYGDLEAFQVTTEMTLEVSGEGVPEPLEETLIQTVSVRRPDAFALDSKGAGQFLSYPLAYLHEGKATLVLPRQGVVRQDGVASIEAFFSSERLGYMPEMGANLLFEQNVGLSFLNKLAFPALGGNWREELAGAEIVEAATDVGGREAVHLLLKTRPGQPDAGGGDGMDLHVWLARGKQPLIVKLEPEVKQMRNDDDPGGKGPVKMKMIVEWRDWKVDPELADQVFQPPSDLDEQEYDSVADLMNANFSGQGPAMELLGAPAPEVRLPVAGEEEPFVLPDLEGEKIVVMLFWATWCQPCKEAIPVLLESAKQFAEKDVVLMGINVGEAEDVVGPFLQREKIGIRSALDGDGRVAAAFRVQNIPQTVIVGRDGTLKHVHVGYGPDFEGLLTKELQALTDAPAAAESDSP